MHYIDSGSESDGFAEENIRLRSRIRLMCAKMHMRAMCAQDRDHEVQLYTAQD